MIGFGNPLLDGYPGSPDDDEEAAERAKDDAARAERARQRGRCRDAHPGSQVAARRGATHGGVVRVATRGGGLASLAYLKMQTPLPETADELCTVARAVHADVRAIRLGAQATEREVRRLSASGELAKYRIVHFATHGVMAGQVQQRPQEPDGLAAPAENALRDGPAHPQSAKEDKFLREPGLILTPPENASGEDDGFLSASEIAGLKLDADWVILSACNTAAGAAPNAEALSGLARAFIYAGARALLVSHWAVYSDATTKLITGAAGAMARNLHIGRAEAMRRSMLALIDKGAPEQAHPAFWAPFVVVGEGAAGR
jgi:CHAT domain-containing protein